LNYPSLRIPRIHHCTCHSPFRRNGNRARNKNSVLRHRNLFRRRWWCRNGRDINSRMRRGGLLRLEGGLRGRRNGLGWVVLWRGRGRSPLWGQGRWGWRLLDGGLVEMKRESTGGACLGFPWLGGRGSHC
jgi:hypothetical protein